MDSPQLLPDESEITETEIPTSESADETDQVNTDENETDEAESISEASQQVTNEQVSETTMKCNVKTLKIIAREAVLLKLEIEYENKNDDDDIRVRSQNSRITQAVNNVATAQNDLPTSNSIPVRSARSVETSGYEGSSKTNIASGSSTMQSNPVPSSQRDCAAEIPHSPQEVEGETVFEVTCPECVNCEHLEFSFGNDPRDALLTYLAQMIELVNMKQTSIDVALVLVNHCIHTIIMGGNVLDILAELVAVARTLRGNSAYSYQLRPSPQDCCCDISPDEWSPLHRRLVNTQRQAPATPCQQNTEPTEMTPEKFCSIISLLYLLAAFPNVLSFY